MWGKIAIGIGTVVVAVGSYKGYRVYKEKKEAKEVAAQERAKDLAELINAMSPAERAEWARKIMQQQAA